MSLLQTIWDDPARWINYIEAFFWFVIGLVHCGFLIRPALRGSKLVAACTFFAFGASDLVEMYTGAWWRPWWLLIWKAMCILVLLVLLVRNAKYLRASRTGSVPGKPADHPQAKTIVK